MTSSGIILGERLRKIRLASDISQTDLAQRLQLKSNGLISKIENGRISVDDEQLRALAEALDSSPEYLSRPAPDVIATRPWLRAYADAPSKTVDAVTADNVILHELVDVARLRRVPNRIPIFDGDLNDDAAIERFAEEVRAAAEISEGGVVGNAVRAAERLGCIVLPLDDELGRHLGLSQYIEDAPYIRVSRPTTASRKPVPGDRQRFTIAHELGHLSLHAELSPPETADDARRIEKQAHRFAAAFLAPAGPITEDLRAAGGRITLTSLSQLKSNWGIAIKALVVRFQHLGIIDSDRATALYKQISARGWNTAEPVPVSNERPIWLSRALEKREREAQESPAATLGLGQSHIDRWLNWEESPRPVADVVSIGSRRSSPRT